MISGARRGTPAACRPLSEDAMAAASVTARLPKKASIAHSASVSGQSARVKADQASATGMSENG